MADLVKTETLSKLASDIMGDVRKAVDQLLCDMPRPQLLPMYLLYFIGAKLAELAQASSFGNHYFRISPYTLGTSAVRILEKDKSGYVRKVSIWIDSQSGGPITTIRVSTGGGGTASGGIRVLAGQVNEVQEVPPDVELWGASDNPINIYVIERA